MPDRPRSSCRINRAIRAISISRHPSEGGAGEFGLIRASQRDAGRCGQVIGRNNAVVRELTEKGVLWKINQLVYRGHKMTLWGTLGSGNYNYMLSYAFHDDGTIEFRGGATATNLPPKPFEAHMHNIIWRVNVDLNGAQNTVSVVRHIENTNSPTGATSSSPSTTTAKAGSNGTRASSRSCMSRPAT